MTLLLAKASQIGCLLESILKWNCKVIVMEYVLRDKIDI